MVTVAFDGCVAECGLHRQILRQSNGSHVGEILRTHLQRAAGLVAHAFHQQTAIRETLNHAFAVFVTHSDVTQIECPTEVGFRTAGFVD